MIDGPVGWTCLGVFFSSQSCYMSYTGIVWRIFGFFLRRDGGSIAVERGGVIDGEVKARTVVVSSDFTS